MTTMADDFVYSQPFARWAYVSRLWSVQPSCCLGIDRCAKLSSVYRASTDRPLCLSAAYREPCAQLPLGCPCTYVRNADIKSSRKFIAGAEIFRPAGELRHRQICQPSCMRQWDLVLGWIDVLFFPHNLVDRYVRLGSLWDVQLAKGR